MSFSLIYYLITVAAAVKGITAVIFFAVPIIAAFAGAIVGAMWEDIGKMPPAADFSEKKSYESEHEFAFRKLRHDQEVASVVNNRKNLCALLKIAILMFVISGILSIVVPNKNDMMVIAGIAAVEQNVSEKVIKDSGETLEGTVSVMNKAVKVLNKSLDEQLKEDKTEPTKTPEEKEVKASEPKTK